MIRFKPLASSDLQVVIQWLGLPHVKNFWSSNLDPKAIEEKYLKIISSETTKAFIVENDDRPIGYAQYYWASEVGDGWWEGYDDETVGIDLYIGDPEYIGKGYGTKLVKKFVDLLFENPDVQRIIVDPHPDNKKIQKIFRFLGFNEIGNIQTPDGPALLMELKKEQWS